MSWPSCWSNGGWIIYFESVYPSYTINYVHGAGKTLLRRWKGGAAEYQSLIFTKRDGGIKQLADLRGKTMVFEDPGSTSGYLMPKLFLSRNGYKLVEKKGYDPNAVATDIQYSFAYLRSKLIDAVLTKQVAAGAISDDDYNGLDEKEEIGDRNSRPDRKTTAPSGFRAQRSLAADCRPA